MSVIFLCCKKTKKKAHTDGTETTNTPGTDWSRKLKYLTQTNERPPQEQEQRLLLVKNKLASWRAEPPSKLENLNPIFKKTDEIDNCFDESESSSRPSTQQSPSK